MKFLLCLGLLWTTSLCAQDALTAETVSADRKLWPKEVMILVPHQVPIIVNGKSSGAMQINGGRVYPVKSIDASKVQVDAMGQLLTFPVADTDLLYRSSLVKTGAAAPAAVTSPAVAAATPAPASKTAPALSNTIAQKIGIGSLVSLDGKKLQTFDARALQTKKYLAIYYSASWCPPCRSFTPKLVSWYKQHKDALAKFDIIFVSSDKSSDDMLNYMIADDMTWPAVKFDRKNTSSLRGYVGSGIPCLVVLDETGKVVSDSFVNGEYIGPSKVLQDLDNLIKTDG